MNVNGVAAQAFIMHADFIRLVIRSVKATGLLEQKHVNKIAGSLQDWNKEIVGIYAAILVCTLFYHITKFFMRKNLGKRIVSVKGGWPFIGQVFTMIKGSPWDTMARWSKQYGGVYSFTLFGNESICVSDPEILRGILQTQMTIFKKDVEWTYKPFLEVLGNGLVTADGESWRRQRVLLSNYLRIEILEQVPTSTFAAVERLCAKLDAKKKSGESIEMAEEFRTLTLQVIAELLMSLDPIEADEVFAKLYLPIMEEGNLRVWNPTRSYNIFLPAWWQHLANVRSLNNYLTKIINTRWALQQQERANPNTNGITRKLDVLDKVLSAIQPDEWARENSKWVSQIRDELKTFVLAGHETSASMLAWTLYEMHASRGDRTNIDRILAEAERVYHGHCDAKGKVVSMPPRSVLAGDKEKAGSAYRGLDYTECCLRESLRKYSIVPTVVRSVSADTMVGPYFFAQGAKIMVNMQGAHHDEQNWAEPMLYRPTRFTEGEIDKIKPYTFLPFIDGPRNCLGQFLSLLESKCVLSMLLKRYKFELMNPENAGIKHSFMVPIIPAHGHYFRVYDK